MHNSGEIDFRGADVILSLTGTDVLRVREATCSSTGASRGSELRYNRTCSIQNPLSTTGSLHRLQVEVAGAPNTTNWTCNYSTGASIATNGTCTGATSNTNLIYRQSVTSGTTLVWAGTGTYSTNFKHGDLKNNWQGLDYICCQTTGNPGGTVDAKIRTWFSDTYAD